MPYREEYEDLALDRQAVKTGDEQKAFNRMGDGVNYSNSIGWQSPEGNFYGQKRVVREYEARIVWDGSDYWACDIPYAYVGKVSALPARGEYFGQFYAVANGSDISQQNTTTGSYWPGPWDIYYWDVDEQRWDKVDWLHKILDHRLAPNPGIKKGAGHVVVFHNVTMLWDGFKWLRAHRHSGIINDEPDIHVPPGFVAGVSQLEEGHNQLLEDFLGAVRSIDQQFIDTTNYVNNQIQDVTTVLEAFNARIEDYASDNVITNTEANLLEVTLNQILAESVELVSIATSLGIKDSDTGYQTALTNIRTGLAKWLNQNAYPIAITLEERKTIQGLIYAVNNAKSKTVEAINDAQRYQLRDYVKEQISDVNNQLQQIDTTFNTISSDLTINQSEASSLKTTLTSLKAESEDLLAMAAEYGLTSYGNSYQIALISLEDELENWIDQDNYPLDITANDRGVILDLIKQVQDRKAVFVSALTDSKDSRVSVYVDSQVAEVQNSISALADGIDRFSQDGFITLAEANGLKQVRDTLIAESDEFLAIATGLELDAEAQAYEAAKDELVAELAKWVNNPPYPKAITSVQRQEIQTLLSTLQQRKVAIVNATQTQTATNATASTQFDLDQFKAIYNGFVRGFTTELKLTYISGKELSLVPDYSQYSYLTVTEQNIAASKSTSVYNVTPVLNWDDEDQEFTTEALEPSYNNYYVYFADRSSGFLLPQADFRGRLFCSKTEPTNNYLGENGLGRNAILAGYIDTDSNTEFLNCLDMSLISRTSDFKEIYRDYSDFDLTYVDQDTLALDQNYGTYGQIYVPESLYYIGTGDARTIKTTSARIELTPTGDLLFDYSSLQPDKLYYVYMAGDLDIYNDNVIGDDGRPIRPGTPGYNPDKDLRLWLFLSTCTPDPISGRLSDTYNGFWTRHVGQVRTDLKGKFCYSANISAIRQKTLNPVYFDGLAEVVLHHKNSYSFYLLKKKGTSGIVMVNGEGVLTYEIADGEDKVHKVNINDKSRIYTESNESQPLSDGPVISSLVGRELFVYMTNSKSFWGTDANSLIVCTNPQVKGYLSASFPGNSARWIATIKLTPTAFGSELVTNGDFTTSGSWTLGSGWSYNSNTKVMEHTSGTATISQSVSITQDKYYQVKLAIIDCDAGSVAPVLGGTRGESFSVAGGFTQNLLAGSSGLIEVSPTNDFTVSVDNVSVKEILTGDLSGNYLLDGINQQNTVIDDTTTAYNSTWSSARFQAELNKIKAMISSGAVYEQEKQYGLPVRLEYYNTSQIRLVPTVDNPVIALPDNTSANLPNTGITFDVSSGSYSLETLYCVWILNSVNGLVLEINTDSPVISYNRLKTMGEGSTKILVGYVGFSSSNAMSGNWNVFSLYGETEKVWSTPITTFNSPSFSLPGLCVAPNRQALTTRTGWSRARWYWRCSYNYNQFELLETDFRYGEEIRRFGTYQYVTANNISGSGNTSQMLTADGYYLVGFTGSTPWAGWRAGNSNFYYNYFGNPDTPGSDPNPTARILFNHESFSAGVHAGNIVLTHTLVSPTTNWYTHGGGAYWHVLQESTPYWMQANGSIVVTRQPSEW